MGLIKIYNATDKDFTSNNGIKSLQARKATIHEELNGDYYVDIECSIDYYDYVKQDNIVVIEGQAFRFGNVNISNKTITTKAWHISYDMQDYVVENVSTTDTIKNLLTAISNTYPTQSLFKFTTDITNKITVDYSYKNLCDCIFNLVERTGGCLVRDNYNISIKKSIEIDNQQVISMGKNIKTYQATENWDDVVTTLIPVGQDGIMLDNNAKIVSEIEYDINYVKSVTFSPNFWVDTESLDAIKADLLYQGQKYVEEHQYPEVCYTIECMLPNAVIGEKILLKHDRISSYLETSVYAIDYNALTNKIDKITFGTFYDSARIKFKSKVTEKIDYIIDDVERLGTQTRASIKTTEESITLKVENLEKDVNSSIEILQDGISSKVSKDGIISSINQTAERISINASKIDFNGAISANGNFRVTTSGDLEATSALLNNCYFTNGVYYRYASYDYPIFTVPSQGILDIGASTIHSRFKGSMEATNGVFSQALTVRGYNVLTTNSSISVDVDSSDVYASLSYSSTYPAYYMSMSNTSGDTNIPTIGWVKARQDSDKRLKTNIVELDDVTDKYMQLSPTTYEFKDGFNNDKIHHGFIAQEVLEVFDDEYDLIEYDTECVTEFERQYCEDGVYRINYENLHALHVKMIQQQQQKLEQQQAQINDLKQLISKGGL